MTIPPARRDASQPDDGLGDGDTTLPDAEALLATDEDYAALLRIAASARWAIDAERRRMARVAIQPSRKPR